MNKSLGILLTKLKKKINKENIFELNILNNNNQLYMFIVVSNIIIFIFKQNKY